MLNIMRGAALLLIMVTACWAADGSMPVRPQRPSLQDFPHREHQMSLGGCTDCHGKREPGPIEGFGQQWAHNHCLGCHQEVKDTGPVECMGCHKY